jgi:S-methylmethionine-dependent homocysteine/selenocysteine methylase
MTQYRHALPQLGNDLFLSDGGIETVMIFQEGLTLPDFAAFDLLKQPEGEAALRKYFRTYAAIARRYEVDMILESATWRASADWGARLGYNQHALVEANLKAIRLLEEIRHEFENGKRRAVISGCVGPRGDGYNPTHLMSAGAAQHYHEAQVRTFASSAADMVTAITMNYVEEAIGIARAARAHDMPVAISFTVETDGKLPTGQTLRSAIEQVEAVTDQYPSYYMINCAHPTHFEGVLSEAGAWRERIRGVRANASRCSHAELNEAPELDDGNPIELSMQYAALKRQLPNLNVMGGCCGTDHRHIEQIAAACAPLFVDVSQRS